MFPADFDMGRYANDKIPYPANREVKIVISDLGNESVVIKWYFDDHVCASTKNYHLLTRHSENHPVSVGGIISNSKCENVQN